jgi:hypothetical protein
VRKRRDASHNHEQFITGTKLQNTLPPVFLQVIKKRVGAVRGLENGARLTAMYHIYCFVDRAS